MQKKYVSYRCHKIKDVKRITKGCRSVAQFIEMVEDNYAVRREFISLLCSIKVLVINDSHLQHIK